MKIGALLYDGLDQIDFTGPFEVLSRLPGASVRTYAKTTEVVHDVNGLALRPDAVLEDPSQLDLLLVPGGPGQEDLMDDQRVLSWLRRRSAEAGIVFSVCTGALLLGAAGLLVGRRATTHWSAIDLLPLYGAIPQPARVVVDGTWVFAAGVTAGIDGALLVARLVAGDAVAQRIQLAIEYAPDPPFADGTPATAAPDVLAAARSAVAALTARRLLTAERFAHRRKR